MSKRFLLAVALIATHLGLAQTQSGLPAPNLGGTGVDSAPYQSASGLTSYITAPTTSGHVFVYSWSPLGSAIAPVALDFTQFMASPPAIGGTLPSTGNFTALTGTSVSVTPDGVHPGYDPLVCNTTQPTLTANYQGWGGSTGGATCTQYILNVPTAEPSSANQFMMFPAASSHAAQGIFVGAWHVAVAPINLTAKTANVTTTTALTTPAVNGYYKVCTNTSITTAATTSSSLPFTQILYTSVNDNIQKTVTPDPNINVSGNATFLANGGCAGPFFVKASTTIQYLTTGYASSGATAMVYDVQISIEVL